MQAKLLDLQKLDSKLDQLAHRKANLPEVSELAQISADQAKISDQLVAVSTRASDIKREQDKLEQDIDQVRQRMSRDQQRLDAGTVSSAKELESLQHEIESLHRRQNDLEETELGVMEQLEEVDTQLAGLQTDAERLGQAAEDAEQRRVAALEGIAKDDAFAREQRASVEVDIAPELLSLYDKLRGQNMGVGAVPIMKRRCGGCQLEMNATDIGRVRDAAPDAVLRCEECGRIQVRTAESGL